MAFKKIGHNIPPRLLVPSLVLCVLVALHGAFTFTGPYRWIADWQLEAMGVYYPKLCVLLAMLALMFLTLGALALARRLGVLQWQDATAEEQAAVDAKANAMRAWIAPIGMLAAGVVIIVLGAMDLKSASGETTLEHFDVELLSRGQRPRSNYVHLEGQLAVDYAMETDEHGQLTFLPLVFESWSPDRPVPAVVRIDAHDVERFNQEGAVGMESTTGLPSTVLRLWLEQGLDVRDSFVLVYGDTPAKRLSHGNIALVIGAVVLLVGLSYGYVVRRRSRATLAPA